MTHLKWAETRTFDLGGEKVIAAGFSYFFDLGQRLAQSEFEVGENGVSYVIGKLGPLNSSPFYFTAR